MNKRLVPHTAIDSSLLLAPLRSFKSRAEAESCISKDNDAALANPPFFPPIAPMHVGSRSYVFKPGQMNIGADEAFYWHLPLKPCWLKLLDQGADKPAGSYNLGMMVEGPRTFFKRYRRRTYGQPFWLRIAEGTRQCYATWSGIHGNALTPHLFLADDGTAPDLRRPLYTARAGRGAVYSRLGLYNSDGELSGYRSTLACLAFNIFDEDKSRDEMLRLSLSIQYAWSYDVSIPSDIDAADIHPKWQELASRAKAGFDRYCSILPADVETWRQNFVKQRKAAEL